jgi:hypothetical protein
MTPLKIYYNNMECVGMRSVYNHEQSRALVLLLAVCVSPSKQRKYNLFVLANYALQTATGPLRLLQRRMQTTLHITSNKTKTLKCTQRGVHIFFKAV